MLEKGFRVHRVSIPSTGRNISVLVVQPTVNAKPVAQTPGILWIHGGGYFLGMPEMVYISRALDLVRKYGAVVVSPAYRLAGEAPFPAALEDCYAALLFLKTHANDLGINDSKIMVGGESAGGGLAVATCLLARDLGDVNIAFQMPLYPMIDDRDTPSSHDNHAPVWNTKRNHRGWNMYLGSLRRGEAPAYAAPAQAANLAGMPPAYTFVGDIEPFRDETLRYVDALNAAGVLASVDLYTGWFHAYDMLFPFAPKSKLAIARFECHYLRAVELYNAPQ